MNLKELSRILNLSTTTVSRALNGYPEVNSETRDRVMTAARRHGYVPNRPAQRLATGRSMAIGHVVSLGVHQVINPIFSDFLLGAGDAYSRHGYELILSIVPEAREVETFESLARRRTVDGVMITSTRVQDSRIDLCQRLGLPFVTHGRDDRPESCYSWVDVNNRRAFRRATELLIDLGHRRIGLINGFGFQSFARRRETGYAEALAERGLAFDPALLRGEEMTEPFGARSVHELLDLPDPPTAFLASSIAIALGAARAIRERGLTPGRDVSIVTHDDDLSFFPNTGPGSGGVPLFTATRSSIRAAGQRAAEMLIARIRDPHAPHAQDLWEVELTIGLSTGPNPHGNRP
jgi:LacI family transcriptional regulator